MNLMKYRAAQAISTANLVSKYNKQNLRRVLMYHSVVKNTESTFEKSDIYSISEKEKKNALAIKDSIEMVDLELSLLSAEIQSFEAQELMLNQNTRVLENNRGIDDLQKVLSLQRAELVTIKKS